ncbi:dTDP-4-dehydrorhamnose 3,5-epimerase [Aureibaculum sp. 2210JD6-5]|uniref:dTDP-4-dehydrorhamnose 3,5-epimerase n=1 Tax=Aureibaculum sp. 2210JD6-5 TaxID=3103957 RepID=UPI002AAC5C35|nr:dTDP-4-dehydrorhamnose 3,5-epimerase [Aureibaculum sp. 2210JD6-5]MDY7396097.1 dTDP-4-dehydrorhamnose 3,5-epimerase [Aureibaculum sp. 2210JD6-5]
MKIEKTFIKDLLILSPTVFTDERGYFFESYNKKHLEKFVNEEFVQDNESLSQKGVLRGLHFQEPPYTQAKLVRVFAGSVLDVSVDLRKKSPTYGQYFKYILSSENKVQLYVPKGFAHGFVVLEENTIFCYKCSDYYNKNSERAILWNDATLNIDWQIKDPIISEKDKNAENFANFVTPF